MQVADAGMFIPLFSTPRDALRLADSRKTCFVVPFSYHFINFSPAIRFPFPSPASIKKHEK